MKTTERDNIISLIDELIFLTSEIKVSQKETNVANKLEFKLITTEIIDLLGVKAPFYTLLLHKEFMNDFRGKGADRAEMLESITDTLLQGGLE